MRLQSVPRETTCPCGRSLGAALVLFFRKGRRALRPAALPSRSWRASGAPCTWAGTATSAYADAPKGKSGWPPRPSRSVWRPAVHPARRGPSRFWICEGEGSVERVRQRCVPRETARPCGRRTSAGDGAGFVGLPHDPHRAGGPPRAFRLLSRPAAYHPGRDPSLAGPSENELWGSAEACWVARGVGGPERGGSRPGLGSR